MAVVCLGLAASSFAQTAQAPAGPSAAKIAVENRRAAFTLIGNSFRWFGAAAKGAAPYDEAEAKKRASRIGFLVNFLDDAFPEDSNLGEPASKAKGDAWTNRADFEKKLAAFKANARAFEQTVANEKGATDGFKAAVASLGQDCKGCHDSYKLK
ncbi:cytochrome c [Methylosinus sp. Sm6]|uniref:c-type cytochrome n=1 Tax=Methylosinus sp. Sm6 TaxID=2866948 RepID=UPI002106BB8D|nr:cytochrome c [Methylosinus sp. Sm6]